MKAILRLLFSCLFVSAALAAPVDLETISPSPTGTWNFSGAPVGCSFASANASVAAAGNSQGTATALTAAFNLITGGTTGQGLRLPPAVPGLHIVILNINGGTGLVLYPDTGDQISNYGANNSSALVPANQSEQCWAFSSSLWECVSLGYARIWND